MTPAALQQGAFGSSNTITTAAPADGQRVTMWAAASTKLLAQLPSAASRSSGRRGCSQPSSPTGSRSSSSHCLASRCGCTHTALAASGAAGWLRASLGGFPWEGGGRGEGKLPIRNMGVVNDLALSCRCCSSSSNHGSGWGVQLMPRLARWYDVC